MFEIIEDEFKLFLKDMKNEESFCRYIYEDEYEEEYSHSDIRWYQNEFIKIVKSWLRENKPKKYIVMRDWCVFVMTIEEAKKRNINNLEGRIV